MEMNEQSRSILASEDRFGLRNPSEGADLCIVLLHQGVDLVGQFLDAGERATTDSLLCDESKPALDPVEPGGMGGDVV